MHDLTGGDWKRNAGHGQRESCRGETCTRSAATYSRISVAAPVLDPPTCGVSWEADARRAVMITPRQLSRVRSRVRAPKGGYAVLWMRSFTATWDHELRHVHDDFLPKRPVAPPTCTGSWARRPSADRVNGVPPAEDAVHAYALKDRNDKQ
jgi:hypothetical protein